MKPCGTKHPPEPAAVSTEWW